MKNRRAWGGGVGSVLLLAVAGCDGGDATQPETGSIAGEVRATGVGVPGVAVELSGLASGNATTNAAGQYVFGGLVPGAYEVEITVPAGFELSTGQTAARAATVQAGQTAQVDWTLIEAGAGPVEEVFLSGSAFAPQNLQISVGTTVVWINDDSGVSHTVTPDDPGQPGVWSDSGLLSPGQQFVFTFETAGTYTYHCQPHSAFMTGTITVE